MAKTHRVGYQEIKALVMQSIRNGTWGPGAPVPGEVDLAVQYGCARATVNRAMRELAEEGIIDRKRKAGTRVKQSPIRQARFSISVIREEIETSGAAYRYMLVNRMQSTAPSWLCAKLDLKPTDQVLQLHCMHYSDKRPFQYEDRWINLSAVPNAADVDFETIGPNEWLVREVPFSDVELKFSATRATNTLADFLDCAVDDALFTVERTTWLNGTNVTFARMYFGVGYQLATKL